MIGDGAVIGTGCKISYGCKIGAHAQLATLAILSTNVTIGDKIVIRSRARLPSGYSMVASPTRHARQLEKAWEFQHPRVDKLIQPNDVPVTTKSS